jgi:stage II sporulation protein GA (sporulation sigma-E factor processing peptidase)
MKVYIELLFLDNFALNFILLNLSASLVNVRRNWWRLAGGAAAGGVYACFMFACGGILAAVPLKILLSLLICWIAFYRKGGWRVFLKSTLCLYVCTFLIGGLAYVFLNASGEGFIQRGGIIIGNSVLRPALLGILAGIVLVAVFKRVYTVKVRKVVYSLRIVFLGRETVCKAYLDTGNALKEPLSGLPVIVAESRAIACLLPPEMAETVINGREAAGEGGEWRSRLRILPYSGISQKKGALLGFKPDSIKIMEKGGEREIRAVIAVTDEVLNHEGSFQALLGPQALA